MNRILLLIVMVVMVTFGCQNVFGQVGKITLLHNGVSTFHTTLSAAQTAAVNGDTIYLPGGTVATTTLSKQLTIIGAGHYPDSTAATYPTIISGNLTFSSGASGGKLVGVSVNVYFSSGSISWTSFEFNRCYLAFDCYSINLPGANAQNILISECVIGSLDYRLTFGSVAFEKNIFGTSNQIYRNPAIFLNNIFYCGTPLSPSYNSLFINNIFIVTGTTLSLSNVNTCTFNNNLFCTTGASLTITNWGTSNNFTNNLTGELAVNTFVNATTTSFNYANNYHLLTSSPGHNFGTDMTDVGIYGTALPCKDGGLPFNPHISSKTIGTMLSPTGNLSVDIKVTAQDR